MSPTSHCQTEHAAQWHHCIIKQGHSGSNRLLSVAAERGPAFTYGFFPFLLPPKCIHHWFRERSRAGLDSVRQKQHHLMSHGLPSCWCAWYKVVFACIPCVGLWVTIEFALAWFVGFFQEATFLVSRWLLLTSNKQRLRKSWMSDSAQHKLSSPYRKTASVWNCWLHQLCSVSNSHFTYTTHESVLP